MTLSSRLHRFLGDEGGERGPYECGGCGRRFELNRQVCPDCGSYLVERSHYEELLVSD